MADVKPFKGILYNRKKVDVSRVVTPPYDVISDDMQARFYRNDPYNIIRLILGKEHKGDTKKNNKYTRAKSFFHKWLKSNILTRDPRPSIYVYLQEYLDSGEKKTRVGFISLMRIEDPKKSGVLPHEYTLRKPKEDRLKLIASVRANLCPIFSLFQDQDNIINKIIKPFIKSKEPLFEIDLNGVVHKLWRVDDIKIISKIRSGMRNKKIFIADGHHRYEVSLLYRNLTREKSNVKKSAQNADYVMMYFTNMNEKSGYF